MAKKRRKRIKKLTILKQIDLADFDARGFDDRGEDDDWWILDPNNDPEYQWVGPYETKKEAQEVKLGLERFWREE